MEEGYERTKIKADSLKEEHERKMERETQRHNHILKELRILGRV